MFQWYRTNSGEIVKYVGQAHADLGRPHIIERRRVHQGDEPSYYLQYVDLSIGHTPVRDCTGYDWEEKWREPRSDDVFRALKREPIEARFRDVDDEHAPWVERRLAGYLPFDILPWVARSASGNSITQWRFCQVKVRACSK